MGISIRIDSVFVSASAVIAEGTSYPLVLRSAMDFGPSGTGGTGA